MFSIYYKKDILLLYYYIIIITVSVEIPCFLWHCLNKLHVRKLKTNIRKLFRNTWFFRKESEFCKEQ